MFQVRKHDARETEAVLFLVIVSSISLASAYSSLFDELLRCQVPLKAGICLKKKQVRVWYVIGRIKCHKKM